MVHRSKAETCVVFKPIRTCGSIVGFSQLPNHNDPVNTNELNCDCD